MRSGRRAEIFQVATGRKTLLQGVLGLRTDGDFPLRSICKPPQVVLIARTGTNNAFKDDDSYSHVSVLQPIDQILMPQLRQLQDLIKPSGTDEGDAISALVIAIQLIADKCKHLKYKKNIYLVTNGNGAIDADDITEITSKIKSDGITLTILGVDFDDADVGVKEENKDPQKAENETTLRQLAEECDGNFGTMEEAIAGLGIPRLKETKPIASYKGLLTLGDPEKYQDTAMCIDVVRYPRIRQAKPPTASSFVVRQNMAPEETTQAGPSIDLDGDTAMQDQDGLVSVKNARTYQVEDTNAPGGKKDVEFDDLAKGYEYGRTAVPISQSDMNVTELETEAGLSIVGFVPREKFDRYLEITETNIIIANPINEKANMALSSLIHALFELDSCAIARFVKKANTAPILLALIPSIEPDYECLIDVELPFAEDMRSYKFPPLDKIITVSGKQVMVHRNLPTKDLQNAMDDFVDSMDLRTFGTDDEGRPAEYAQIEDTYSPVLHHINQAVRLHAVDPKGPVPKPYPILSKYSNPPEELLEQARPYLDAVAKAANVKKVPPKPKFGRGHGKREMEKPLSGLDVDALLNTSGQKKVVVSAENAIPDFKNILRTTEDLSDLAEAAQQMTQRIEEYISHSVGHSGYSRAIEALGVFREEMIELEEPGLYNSALKGIKEKISTGDLGGERKEMWWEIKKTRLGLIDKRLSPVSDVTEDQAKEFWSLRKD